MTKARSDAPNDRKITLLRGSLTIVDPTQEVDGPSRFQRCCAPGTTFFRRPARGRHPQVTALQSRDIEQIADGLRKAGLPVEQQDAALHAHPDA